MIYNVVQSGPITVLIDYLLKGDSYLLLRWFNFETSTLELHKIGFNTIVSFTLIEWSRGEHKRDVTASVEPTMGDKMGDKWGQVPTRQASRVAYWLGEGHREARTIINFSILTPQNTVGTVGGAAPPCQLRPLTGFYFPFAGYLMTRGYIWEFRIYY